MSSDISYIRRLLVSWIKDIGRQSFHARSIETDTGWKISLDRGLDIFQPYDYKDAFCLANSIQEERLCKAFEVTYILVE